MVTLGVRVRSLLNALTSLTLVTFLIIPALLTQTNNNQLAGSISDTPVTNFETVTGLAQTAVTAPDGSVFVAGSLGGVGGTPTYTGGTLIDTTSNSGAIHPFPFGFEDVHSFASDGQGGWYVGGEFTTLGNDSRNRLAHVLDDGTVDPNFDPSVDGDVHSIAYDQVNDILYAGGAFENVNTNSSPVERIYVAGFDGTDGTATSFNPEITNPNNSEGVLEIELDVTSGLIYVAGRFAQVNENINPVERLGLAVFNISNSVATSFNADLSHPTSTLTVTEIELDLATDRIFIFGNFDTVKTSTLTIARNGLAVFETDTGLTTSFNPELSVSDPYGIGISGIEYDASSDVVYLSGHFETINASTTPISSNGLAGFNASNGALTTFNPQLAINPSDKDINVRDIEIDDTTRTLYAIGAFYGVASGSTSGERTTLASFNLVNGDLTDFDPILSQAGASELAYDSSTDTLAVGGFTWGIGGTRRNGIAKIKPDGTLDENFNPDIHGFVYTLMFDETSNTIFASGAFGSVNNNTAPTARVNFAGFNATDGSVTNFDPGFSDANGFLDDLAISISIDHNSNLIYLAGIFNSVNNNATPLTRNNIAAFDLSTSIATSFDPDVDDAIIGAALDVDNNQIFIGGDFRNVNSNSTPSPRNRIAAIDLSTGAATTFDPDVDSPIYRLILDSNSGLLYAAGSFSSVNNNATPLTRNKLAAFDVNTSIASSFDPDVDSDVIAIGLDETQNDLYFGGFFSSINNNTTPVARSVLASVDTSTSIANDFNPPAFGIANGFAFDTTNSRVFGIGAFFEMTPSPHALGAIVVYGEPFDPIIPVESTTTTTTSTTIAPPTTTPLSPTTTVPAPRTIPKNAPPTKKPNLPTNPRIELPEFPAGFTIPKNPITLPKKLTKTGDAQTTGKIVEKSTPKVESKEQAKPWLILGDFSVTGSNLWDMVLLAICILILGFAVRHIVRETDENMTQESLY